MNFLNAQEDELLKFLRSPAYSYEILRCAVAFPILILTAFCAGQLFPAFRDSLVEQLMLQVNSLTGESGALSAAGLLNNNLTACAMSILCGAVPFLFLPALSLGTNAMMLGIMASYYVANGYSLTLYLAALIPHGVFELPALVLSLAGGLYLCGRLTRRCRGDKSGGPLFQSFFQVSQVYLMVIFPLLAAAALTEAYVTPLVLSLFV